MKLSNFDVQRWLQRDLGGLGDFGRTSTILRDCCSQYQTRGLLGCWFYLISGGYFRCIVSGRLPSGRVQLRRSGRWASWLSIEWNFAPDHRSRPSRSPVSHSSAQRTVGQKRCWFCRCCPHGWTLDWNRWNRRTCRLLSKRWPCPTARLPRRHRVGLFSPASTSNVCLINKGAPKIDCFISRIILLNLWHLPLVSRRLDAPHGRIL